MSESVNISNTYESKYADDFLKGVLDKNTYEWCKHPEEIIYRKRLCRHCYNINREIAKFEQEVERYEQVNSAVPFILEYNLGVAKRMARSAKSEGMRRFKVIFDYSRRQMILEPNRDVSDKEEYDMSGMLLVAEGTDFKTFKIRRTIENSPAAAAGLREGDIISAVDGKPASDLTLEQTRQIFMRRGRSHRLTIERGGQQLQAKIKLKELT